MVVDEGPQVTSKTETHGVPTLPSFPFPSIQGWTTNMILALANKGCCPGSK